MRRLAVGILVGVLCSVPAAAITVDGTRDAAYGPPLAVQTVETGFGDAMPPGNVGGSELDAAYARIEGGRLFLLLTGNHEPNLNRLEVFIDSRAGGENTLSGIPAYDVANSSQVMGGLTFDAGFAADYHLFSRWGGGMTPGPYEVDFFDRQGGVAAMVPGSGGVGSATVGLISTGSIVPGNIAPNASGTALTQPLAFAIDDNNAAGVAAGMNAANAVAAAAVATGMEFSIALADLGNPPPGSQILVTAMVNNAGHNFLSNQVLSGLMPPQGSLGGDGGGVFTGDLSGVDFTLFPGLQYFSIRVPEEPLLVALESFSAEITRRGVRLTWSTTLEIDNAGFRLLREQVGRREKSLEVITPELLPARGNNLLGASYEFVDTTRGLHGTVRYYLEDIDLWGRATRHGPVEVELGAGRRNRGNPGRSGR